MAGTALDTLTSGVTETSPVAWPGGNGVFSLNGILGESNKAQVVILENDIANEYQPSGDTILHNSGNQISFFLPACNVRARIVGADDLTNVTPYIA